MREESVEDEPKAGGAEQPEDSVHIIRGHPPVRLDGVRVLVVDDEADARRVLTLVLERVGALVATADSVASALEAVAKARPDVLVSDLGMPDQDGFDLIRQLRDEGPVATALPAVALTAFVQKDAADLALLAGFQAHLPKPVDPHDLTSIIARLAGRTG
jgi:CheY-like chemotaxis protein